MKDLSKLSFPGDVKFSRDHEWVKKEGDLFIIGISDYAQDQLGEVVYVELPEPGDSFSRGEEFGSVESVKAVSELFIPMGGEIVEVNTALESAPDLVNSSPFGEGWMLKLRAGEPDQFQDLLLSGQYLNMLGE
ncbi:MAG: glycine cleavage system protein GcvH [Desulfobacterales bacterium]|nr:glycine cleavage system protein GcvH [Desulfobacterales bacterium]